MENQSTTPQSGTSLDSLPEIPSREELVRRASSLREALWADAAKADKERRISDENVAQIVNHGLTKLMTPRRLGGFQVDVRTLVEVEIALGQGDASAGWITGVMNSTAFMVALFPEQAQREVWAEDPGVWVCGQLAPSATAKPAKGGYSVSGRWGYMSGSQHAKWAIVGFPVEGGPPMSAIVPMSDLKYEDTWFVTGLRATGSNTTEAQNLFVPQHRAVPTPSLAMGRPPSIGLIEQYGENIYRANFWATLLLSLLGTLVGETETALKFVVDKAAARPIATTNYARQTDSVAFQVDIAEAAAKIDAAKSMVFEIADEVDRFTADRSYPDQSVRIRSRLRSAWAARELREAVDLLMTAHGSSAFAEFNPLSRIWRNISVGTRHAGLNFRIPQELYGRELLGLDPKTVSFPI